MMQSLATQFVEGNFRYIQILRQGDCALYSQEHKASGVRRYEVVRIRVRPTYVFPNGYVVLEHEAYPGSSAWGRDGWTFHLLPEAEAHYEYLRRQNTYCL